MGLGCRVGEVAEMVHVEPDDELVAAPESELLSDAVDVLERRGVVEVAEVRGEVDAPHGELWRV